MDKQKIQVHPLVVMTISDHYTRALYRQPKDRPIRVIGLVLGLQNGLSLDVANCIEICRNDDGVVDSKFAAERIEAYKKMYPELEVVGWYSATKGSGDEPTKDDFDLSTDVISAFCENPILFLFNVASKQASDKKILPLFCFEA
jgi:COP9 signalosome complex subunit 6